MTDRYATREEQKTTTLEKHPKDQNTKNEYQTYCCVRESTTSSISYWTQIALHCVE